MAANISDILKELGWGDGFRIPVANKENKLLEEEIERKTKYKISLHEDLESMKERLEMVKKHKNNIKIQQDLNQKLLTAHSAQLDKEDHLYKLTSSTEYNLRQEIRNFNKEWKEVNERIFAIEKDLAKLTKKLDASKKAVKFDENNLLKWEEVLNRKEEDNQLIEEYLKQDAKKYKELEQKRQKLSMEVETYQQAIAKAINEAREMEVALDRTVKLYDEALKERRQMINQWTQSVAVLQQRDENIQAALREIETLRTIGKDKMNVLHETEKFLNDQLANNKQLEDSIKQAEKKLFNMRNENLKITDTIRMYEIELKTQRKDVENLSRRVQQLRADIKRKRSEIENKIKKMQQWKERIEDLKTSLEEITNQNLNIEDRTKQFEAMLEEEEKRKSAITKEVNRLQAVILRTTNKISEFEHERKVLEMQKEYEKRKVETLEVTYTKEKKLLNEKREDLYHVEFEVHKCEMKLDRVKGHERDQTEVEKRQKAIEELENVLAEKTKIAKLLKAQISSLEYDMRKITNSLANDSDELERLKNKRQDLVLLMDGGEKLLKSAQNHNEERQVEENILRLKVSQMESLMASVGDKVYNLQKYRLHLDAAMKEREEEVAIQKESFIVQKRILAGECSELRNAISERKNRIKQLQARYDSGIAAFGTNPDGTPITTTYIKVQTAQERYLLQEQGDKLDETIRKTEQEILSMENTLRIVHACNDKYKASLNTVDEKGPEYAEQKRINEEMYKIREILKQRKIQFKCLTQDLQRMQENHVRVMDDMERTKEQKHSKEQQLSNLEKQIAEQKEKILRADKNLRKVFKDIQNMCTCIEDKTILLQQKDIRLREIQEQNALALEDISELTIHHMETEPYIKKLLAEKAIELPSIPHSIDSPTFIQCRSITSSYEYGSKSTSRSSSRPTCRESIGSVITLTPSFDEAHHLSTTRRSNSTGRQSKCGKSSKISYK